MKLIKKYKYILTCIIIIIIIIACILVKKNLNDNKYEKIEEEKEITISEKIEEEKENKCSVDIKWAVNQPNVYLVDCDNNVNDIIKLAGGLKKDADTSVTNLAKKVTDEMVIIIYTKQQVKQSNIVDTVVKVVEKECICPNIQNDSCINTQITSNITNQEDSDNGLININTATKEKLLTIPGIGEAKANAIIKYREANGSFNSIEDIQKVDGIGSKLYEEIKIYITT